MAILVDLSNLLFAGLFSQFTIEKKKKDSKIDNDLLRHVILNNLNTYKSKFEKTYGKMIICNDGKNCWRKSVFPYYKSTRKQNREKSPYDWEDILEKFNIVKNEIKDIFPFQNIEVPGAEADDIIAIACKFYLPRSEKHLILSSDKDLLQLQKEPTNIYQYSLSKKKMVEVDDVFVHLNTLCILGDRTDGIPNFLSPDNTFVDGLRQKTIHREKLAHWCKQNPEDYCTSESIRFYKRNEELIDFRNIPVHIEVAIKEHLTESWDKSPSKIFNYMMAHSLVNLLPQIQNFRS